MLSVKYRKRSVFVIALISLFLYFHIVCFNETVKNAFGYYDGYKSMVFVIDFWIGSACGELYNLEDSKKLRFYVKPKFRFFWLYSGNCIWSVSCLKSWFSVGSCSL